MSLGENIQFMRKMHNSMTQEELAEKMGVSRQTVSKWEMDSSFPEMEKAIALSELFNCSLDELIKDDLNLVSDSYHDIRVEKVDAFRYVRYAVISAMPEDDAKNHLDNFAKYLHIDSPKIIGWDFPFVSQEQTNAFHMHGYCAALILPEEVNVENTEVVEQPRAKYAAITIENPFNNPFSTIPNAYKTLYRYIEVNGLKKEHAENILECFEKEYVKDEIQYMDVYIAID